MSDKLLDTSQIINGIAVMLSFYVGYKYALKKNDTSKLGSGSAAKPDNPNVLTFSEYNNNYKMVLVVRNDLRMGKGKIAAQCSHGAIGAYQIGTKRNPRLVRLWENAGSTKIALKVESEEELMEIKKSAEAIHLGTCLIRDAGRTQIEPNSKTVLAIGPANVDDIDKVTGHLKLL